jgi:integrase
LALQLRNPQTDQQEKAGKRLSDFPMAFPEQENGIPMKLAQPLVSKLALPPGKADAIYFDDDIPGLGLRLRAGGRRSWIFQYQIGAKQRRMSLGLAAAITLAQARKTAGELHARVRLGEDPAASRAEGRVRAADTVAATLRIYLPEKKAALKANSYRCTERHLLDYAKPLHGLGLAMVTRRDIGTLLAGLAVSSGNVSANRTRASLSGFYTWAMQRGLAELNPVIGSHEAPEAPRERVLSREELAAVWRLAGDDARGAIVRLLILTGCRAAEIGGLRCDEIKGDMIVLPPKGQRTAARTSSPSPARRSPFSHRSSRAADTRTLSLPRVAFEAGRI